MHFGAVQMGFYAEDRKQNKNITLSYVQSGMTYKSFILLLYYNCHLFCDSLPHIDSSERKSKSKMFNIVILFCK